MGDGFGFGVAAEEVVGALEGAVEVIGDPVVVDAEEEDGVPFEPFGAVLGGEGDAAGSGFEAAVGGGFDEEALAAAGGRFKLGRQLRQTPIGMGFLPAAEGGGDLVGEGDISFAGGVAVGEEFVAEGEGEIVDGEEAKFE